MTSIRDPIWKWINLSTEERQVLDSPLFQRLRRISQLTTASIAFPSANHTRFSHSLGVMHVAGLIALSLQSKHPDLISEGYVNTIRLAGMLHDIAHGPFSHGFDDTVYCRIYASAKGHDEHRFVLLHHLKGLIPSLNEEGIARIWRGEDTLGYSILSGPFGADRLDFLQRDAYSCGLSCGFEPSRIISSATLIERDGVYFLTYPERVADDLARVLDYRYWMYRNVYMSKSSIRAQVLLFTAIRQACDKLRLVERVRDIDQFICLTDDRLLVELEDAVPEILKRYNSRILPRIVSKDTANAVCGESHRVHCIDRGKFTSVFIQQRDGKCQNACEYLLNEHLVADLSFEISIWCLI